MRHYLIIALFSIALPLAASTEITYQGQLTSSAVPYDGIANLSFQLYDSETGGNPVGPLQGPLGVAVNGGLFQVDLDFGDVYDGERWLAVSVNGTPLSPRQRVAPTPTAIRAHSLDGLGSMDFQRGFQRTLVVSPTGDASVDGTALADTLTGIDDATQANPVLVFIEPGTYTLSNSLAVPSHVYVRGAGQGATRITRTGDPGTVFVIMLSLGGSSAISDLTLLGFGGGSDVFVGIEFNDSGLARVDRVAVEVRNANQVSVAIRAIYSGTQDSTLSVSDAAVVAAGGDAAWGISASSRAALDIRASTIIATGAATNNDGVRARGVLSRLTDSRVTSDGTGVMSDNENLVVRNCEVFGQDTGARGELSIFDSRVEGVDYRALTSAGGSTTTAASTQLIGTVVGANCVATYDGNFNFFEGCP